MEISTIETKELIKQSNKQIETLIEQIRLNNKNINDKSDDIYAKLHGLIFLFSIIFGFSLAMLIVFQHMRNDINIFMNTTVNRICYAI